MSVKLLRIGHRVSRRLIHTSKVHSQHKNGARQAGEEQQQQQPIVGGRWWCGGAGSKHAARLDDLLTQTSSFSGDFVDLLVSAATTVSGPCSDIALPN
jgi:hypothetical protein